MVPSSLVWLSLDHMADQAPYPTWHIKAKGHTTMTPLGSIHPHPHEASCALLLSKARSNTKGPVTGGLPQTHCLQNLIKPKVHHPPDVARAYRCL